MTIYLFRSILFGSLFIPYAILIFYTGLTFEVSFDGLIGVLFFTFWQAALCGCFIVILGYIGALGLFSISNSKVKHFFNFISVLPTLLPSLVVIMSFLLVWEISKIPVHFGVIPVITLQVLINLGLASVLWQQLILSRLGGAVELALVEGASRLQLIKVIWSGLRREILLLFFGFFSLCFTSFSIPLVLGGDAGRTLEVYIYEDLLLNRQIGSAILLAGLQWIFFGLLVFWLPRLSLEKKVSRVQLSLLGWRPGLFVIILTTLISTLGLFSGLLQGFQKFIANEILIYSLPKLFVNSLSVGLSVSIFLFLFFYWTTISAIDQLSKKLLIGYSTPSVVLVGLGLFLLPITVPAKIAVGLCLLFFPFLYRFYIAEQIESLSSQVTTAKCYGADEHLIIRSIVWPQIRPQALLASGLGGFWACGDFAFSSVVTGEISNLALTAKSLMASYHFELSLIYVWFSLIMGLLIFAIYYGASYVTRRKLEN